MSGDEETIRNVTVTVDAPHLQERSFKKSKETTVADFQGLESEEFIEGINLGTFDNGYDFQTMPISASF